MWLSFSSQLLFCLRGRSGEDSFLVIRAPGRAPRVNQVTLRITDNQFLLQQLLLSFSFSSLSILLLLLLVILLLLLLLLLLSLHYILVLLKTVIIGSYCPLTDFFLVNCDKCFYKA